MGDSFFVKCTEQISIPILYTFLMAEISPLPCPASFCLKIKKYLISTTAVVIVSRSSYDTVL